MARGRLLLAAALAAVALAVLVAPAGASVPGANTTKFCTAVKKIGSQTSSQPTKTQAKTWIKQFKTAAKNAPPKIKSSISTITQYLGYVASGDASKLANLAKPGASNGYANAISTYTTYVATNCT
jgi:hypothetical protein